jgi:hypothetical protein
LEKPLNNSWNDPEHSQSFSKIPVSRSDSWEVIYRHPRLSASV